MTFQELIRSGKPVLVDFYATWCGPCKVMTPILDDVKKAIGDTGSILKVDIDRNPQAASHFSIQGVPTLILFKDGKPVWRQSGVRQKAELVELFKSFA